MPHLAADFWAAPPDASGLRLLFGEVATRFPAEAVPLLELCAGLARAGGDSLAEVMDVLGTESRLLTERRMVSFTHVRFCGEGSSQ